MAAVITGMGVRCAIGAGLAEFERGLREGRNGRVLVPPARFDTSSPAYRTKCGAALLSLNDWAAGDDPTVLTALATAVAGEALTDAGYEARDTELTRTGLVLGTTVGSSFAFIRYLRGRLGLPGGDVAVMRKPCTFGSIAGQVADRLGLRGPLSVISTACAAGTNAIGRAADLIRTGQADWMVAGGVDVFSELTFSGFNALQLLAREDCRPFDEGRDGLMLGDAAAFVVLESRDAARARGTRGYAEVAGYAIANEAYHPTGPDPEGATALSVMRRALAAGGLDVEQLDYINAHGTGTRANDAMELKAVRALLSRRSRPVYISSIKSMVGHTLGAAGSIELVATTLGISRGFVPPTSNLDRPDDSDEGLIFVRQRAVEAELRIALSNSFGFGGNVAAIALTRWAVSV
jgi:3-oxoacyl-[acyl-carrier-protein] synthase II